MPDPRLQEHQRLADPLRGLRLRRQGRPRDLLLAAHHLQHGARLQHEPRQVDTVPRCRQQRGLQDGGARPRASSAGQAAQILSVGHLRASPASKPRTILMYVPQ